MDIIAAIILGVVQGLTEFLPVSSSAHLVIFHELVKFEANLAFDTVLHVGTLLAVVGYYFKDVISLIKAFFISLKDLIEGEFVESFKNDEYVRMVWLIIIATIPTGIIGLVFKDFFESLFSNISAVGFFLLITGVLLWYSEKVKTGDKDVKKSCAKDSLLIGLAQSCAIAPGISRSGATIASSLILGMDRETAARFSFLLSIPAILGAAIVQVKDIGAGMTDGLWVYVLGFIAATISGYIAIKVLLKVIREKSLTIFSYYCWIVGSIILIITLVLPMF